MQIFDTLFSFMKEERKFLEDSMLMVFTNSFSSIFLFLINLILSRIFGPDLFGNFKVVLYLSGFLIGLIDLGGILTLTKYIAEFRIRNKKRIGYLVWWFLRLKVMAFLVVFFTMLMFRNQIALYFLHDASLNYLIFSLLFVLFASLFNILNAVVVGYENFRLFSISVITTNILTLMLGTILGYFFGVFYAILGFGVSVVIGRMVCVKFLVDEGVFNKNYEQFDVKKIFWKFSLPIYFLQLPNYLGNAIVPILSLFFTTRLIGYYSFSFMFYYAALVIPTSLASVLFPKISRLNGVGDHNRMRESLKKVLFLYSLITVAGIVGCLFFSEFIVKVIAPEYIQGILLFKSLVCWGFVVGYFNIFMSYLSAREKLKETALIVLAQNVLLLIISFVVMSLI